MAEKRGQSEEKKQGGFVEIGRSPSPGSSVEELFSLGGCQFCFAVSTLLASDGIYIYTGHTPARHRAVWLRGVGGGSRSRPAAEAELAAPQPKHGSFAAPLMAFLLPLQAPVALRADAPAALIEGSAALRCEAIGGPVGWSGGECEVAAACAPANCTSGTTPVEVCLLYTSPSPRDGLLSRMPSSA